MTRGDVWTPYVLEQIKERFPVEGPKLLSSELNINFHTLRSKARRMGLVAPQAQIEELNRQTLKQDYFVYWSQDMAYDLGWAFSDGCVELGKFPFYRVAIQRQDEEVLYSFRSRVGSHNKVGQYTEEKEGVIRLMSRLYTCGRPIPQSLADIHGVVPNKSNLDVSFPLVPEEFLGSFCRGYFEGDGCFSGCQLRYLGSHRFIETLNERLITRLSLPRNKIMLDDAVPTLSRIAWGAREDVLKLYHFMYPKGQEFPYLGRKRKLIREFVCV